MSKRCCPIALALLLSALGCAPQKHLLRIDCNYGLQVGAGDNQVGPAGTQLPDTLALSLRENESMFCAAGLDANFAWGVESGGGMIAPVASRNTWNAVWTLGPAIGAQHVRVTWVNAPEDADPKSVVFTAVASP